jgi:hypothetical protein
VKRDEVSYEICGVCEVYDCVGGMTGVLSLGTRNHPSWKEDRYEGKSAKEEGRHEAVNWLTRKITTIATLYSVVDILHSAYIQYLHCFSEQSTKYHPQWHFSCTFPFVTVPSHPFLATNLPQYLQQSAKGSRKRCRRQILRLFVHIRTIPPLMSYRDDRQSLISNNTDEE